jgi:hypothetical protein
VPAWRSVADDADQCGGLGSRHASPPREPGHLGNLLNIDVLVRAVNSCVPTRKTTEPSGFASSCRPCSACPDRAGNLSARYRRGGRS